ncbi:MAG: sigma-54-dependent transcriptional regulator [Phycisphaerae bacterium]
MAGGDNVHLTETAANILLVDDDQIILDSLSVFLEGEGFEVTPVETVARATDLLSSGHYDLVITDVNTPEADGMKLLRHIRTRHSETAVIVITGYGTIESAVEAIRNGAYDYLTKPIMDEDVKLSVRRALQQQNLQAENTRLKHTLADRYSFGNIVGQDYRMSKVFELITAVADSNTTVLITGESGTGKSMIARAIHTHSPRADQAFVEVSCGALPDTLLESELFGHVRGAFTHAVTDKEGKFAAADGGTIFLDEIATASPQLQIKLLRVLQERTFEPLGSNETRRVDVRVLIASNRDLWEEVKADNFRQDLFYRINVVNIDLPPLRDRLGDIPLLAEHFLRRFVRQTGRTVERFDPETIELMRQYHWPGNIRELENCVERAVVLCRDGVVTPDGLPPAVLTGASEVQTRRGYVDVEGRTLAEALETSEREIIRAALKSHEGSRQTTAAQLGIDRTTLYKKMKKYDLMDL